jgi:hypothetical protein
MDLLILLEHAVMFWATEICRTWIFSHIMLRS